MHERFGFLDASLSKPAGQRRIWVHAVSVGEVVGAMPLLQDIRKKLIEYDLVVSTTTKTGRDMLLKSFPDIKTFYFPFDFPWMAARMLRTIAPDIVALMETELWPNMMAACRRRGAPVLLLNGRVSDRMAGAGRAIRAIYGFAFQQLSALAMQTRRDADRILELGAPPGRVSVIGNMKFDGMLTGVEKKQLDELHRIINPENRPLFVAGSTHPGEERLVEAAFEAARERFPELMLVLAPRHIERADEVEGLAQIRDFSVLRRTRIPINEQGHNADIIILDTIGELRGLYALATVCFVGGSLVERGGHNVLEPAACGKAPFYGPHTANFRDSVAALERGGGGRPVKDADELAAGVIECLENPEKREQADARALEVLKSNAGARDRAFELLKSFLK